MSAVRFFKRVDTSCLVKSCFFKNREEYMALSKSLLFGGFLRPSLEVVVLIFLIPVFRILKTAPGVRFARTNYICLQFPPDPIGGISATGQVWKSQDQDIIFPIRNTHARRSLSKKIINTALSPQQIQK